MSLEENNPQLPEEKAPVVYASPMKRLWAWVGVVYMVFLTLLVTYFIAFGTYLGGISGIMVCPALVGVALSSLLLWRDSPNKTTLNRVVLALIVGLCGALVLWSLWTGIPALSANFGVR